MQQLTSHYQMHENMCQKSVIKLMRLNKLQVCYNYPQLYLNRPCISIIVNQFHKSVEVHFSSKLSLLHFHYIHTGTVKSAGQVIAS